MNSMKKKKIPPKVEDMTKEQLQMFLKKKRGCESAAHNIVLSMLDDEPSEETFIKYLTHITQCHYDDITEERAIAKKCGYPLCSKEMPKNLPGQQYTISSKTNKVYDITTRKNFCSNECYRASAFVKDQILTSPLWYRDESDNKDFKLLPLNAEKKGIIIGDEIDLSIIKKVEVDNQINNGFSSLLDFTEASLAEMSLDNKDIKLESVEVSQENKQANESQESSVFSDSTHNSNKENIPKEELSATNAKQETTKNNFKTIKNNSDTEVKTPSKKRVLPNTIIGDVVERKPENRVDPIISAGQTLQESREKIKPKKTTAKKQPTSLVTFIIHIEKCLSEWFSLETLLFLFGEARVRQMVSDKGDCIKEYLNNMASGLFYKSTSYDQYQQLCRKLNLLELEDRRYDSNVVCTQETKPLPHYSILKEENQILDIKVRAFFKGDTTIQAADMSAAIIEEANRPNEDDEEEGKLTNLPPVDKTSQNALRRKIVLTGLDKVLPDLLQTLGVSSREISGDLRLLVGTFHLQAHNILFKPAQWNMIAIVVIKLLSIRDARLAQLLQKEIAHRHLQLLLMSYEQDGGYLERLILWLTDIDRLLDSTDTQLTIGLKGEKIPT